MALGPFVGLFRAQNVWDPCGWLGIPQWIVLRFWAGQSLDPLDPMQLARLQPHYNLLVKILSGIFTIFYCKILPSANRDSLLTSKLDAFVSLQVAVYEFSVQY